MIALMSENKTFTIQDKGELTINQLNSNKDVTDSVELTAEEVRKLFNFLNDFHPHFLKL